MTALLDYKGIAKGFSAAAESYDRWARVQSGVAERLTALLPGDFSPKNILDVGCGTGILTNLVAQKYPDAAVQGIDIAPGMVEYCRRHWKTRVNVKFTINNAEIFEPDSKYDLVVSSCAFQWFRDPAQTVKNLANHLKSGGILAAAMMVEGSFEELMCSYRVFLGIPMPGLKFLKVRDYEKMIAGSGLKFRTLESDSFQIFYPNVWEVLRTFKGMGSTFRHQPNYASLSVSQIRGLAKYYQQRYGWEDGAAPVAYRILYFVAERSV